MNFSEKSIKEIKEWLEQVNFLPPEVEQQALLQDERSGVRALIERIQQKRKQAIELERMWQEMNVYERKLRSEGYRWIAGIDEVGRGPLAGPVVSAAVILPADFYLPGLTDSKQLSKQMRELFYDRICERAVSVGIAVISVEIIDEINILQATHRAMGEAIAHLQPTPDHLLVDALKLKTTIPQEAVIGGDAKSVSIAAASVVAKVTRDRIMTEWASQYPQYGFDRHMGYGTKDHLEAISRYGVTDIHRKTFAGVKEWV